MLLLVVEAELDAIERLAARRRRVEERVHPLVDRVAVGAHLVEGRPRQAPRRGRGCRGPTAS